MVYNYDDDDDGRLYHNDHDHDTTTTTTTTTTTELNEVRIATEKLKRYRSLGMNSLSDELLQIGGGTTLTGRVRTTTTDI